MHRRTQSAHLDDRDVLPANAEVAVSVAASAVATATSHGIEVAVEFKPVEHMVEPLDNDRPVQCPLPEPSILNDGRIWKERASVTMHRRGDLPVMKEGETLEQESGGNTRPTSLSEHPMSFNFYNPLAGTYSLHLRPTAPASFNLFNSPIL